MEKKIVKKKLVLRKSVRRFLNHVLITVIIFLIGCILVKENPKLKNTIIENVYEKSFQFTKIKQFYQKHFGNILSIDKIVKEEQPVFSETLTYSKKNAYKDGVALTVANQYMVPALESGIVVFMGEKEGYGTTVTIEQINGIDLFYANINAANIKLYDYIEKGEFIGEAKSDKLYLIFQKEGKNLNYKDYI